MVFAPVGIRCPEHAGSTQARGRPRRLAAPRVGSSGAVVTKALIAVNVGIYLLQLAMGAGLSADTGWIFTHGALVADRIYSDGTPAGVANGEWWRLITAAFLHYGPLHLAMNMLVLWFIGGPIENVIGRAQYLLLYVVSGLAGSAGALIVNPNAITVGASGAIFGLFGALAVLEYQHTGNLIGGPAVTLIVLNLVISFAVAGIAWQAHVGGLLTGGLLTAAYAYAPRNQRTLVQAGATVAVVAVLVIAVLTRSHQLMA
jgi:membrane associated rhomboid family serine protease